tara:strand:+ start:519 stop:1001 length:483 start_codon:yes stop_codon:yes gene_type:complete
MGSGIQHEKATKRWSLISGCLVALLFGWKTGLLAGMAFAFGGLWLSPDLDTESKPLQRWGLFKIIWLPYRKLIKHRSILSHAPVIGTLIRLIYLGFIISVVLSIVHIPNRELLNNLGNLLYEQLLLHKSEVLIILIAIELSVWLHIMQDINPINKRKKKN